MAVHKVAVAQIGRSRDDLVAGLEAVDAARVEPAAGRNVRGARDVPLEQDVLLLDSREGDFAAYGLKVSERVSLFEEGIEILRRAFTEDKVYFTGKRHTLHNVAVT